MTARLPPVAYLPGWDDAPPTPLDEACRIDIARAEACERAGWALSAFDDAARTLDDGRRGGRLRAALRLRGLAYGEWDRLVAEAVRVRSPGPFAARWAALAATAPRAEPGHVARVDPRGGWAWCVDHVYAEMRLAPMEAVTSAGREAGAALARAVDLAYGRAA